MMIVNIGFLNKLTKKLLSDFKNYYFFFKLVYLFIFSFHIDNLDTLELYHTVSSI